MVAPLLCLQLCPSSAVTIAAELSEVSLGRSGVSRVLVQALCLVLDVGGDICECFGVLTSVVRAEQELPGLQVYPDVGLSPARIAAVGTSQFWGRVFCR